MPILACEPLVDPDDLLSQIVETESRWLRLSSRSRQENKLIRRLRSLKISFDRPLLLNRLRTAAGRRRTSYVFMLGNDVFARCSGDERHQVLRMPLLAQTLAVGTNAEPTAVFARSNGFCAFDLPCKSLTACQQELRFESNANRLLALRAAS